MDVILILLAIIWVIVPIAAKKSQQKAKAEAERQRAMRQQAPQPQRAPQAMRTVPIAPSIRPAQASVQTMREGTGSNEGEDGPTFEGEQPHEAKPNLATVQSTLSEAKTSITHTVTVSSESGHAHEETSANGAPESCPPEKAPAARAAATQAAAAPQADESAFAWDAQAARSGLVMAEILGPCLALRD